ncbi:BMP family ABC transporter substrate-binding protein [Candidatus Poribacteria bacterium]|nr:BMP family ABC transporter substrate-binding protein [Candidatus Poribacteria bacterium]
MNKVRNSLCIQKTSIFLLILSFCIGSFLLGCSDTKEKANFKVAMLLPSSISDGGWNQLAYEGLKAVETELGAKIGYVESPTPSEQEEHFRHYAADGYDLIFGHGYEYQAPALRVAPDFPNTIFVTSSGGTSTENIAPVNFRIEQPAYLMGIIAGMMSKEGKIGTIGGDNINSIKSTFEAFEAGARKVNPNIDVRNVYVGNWHDANKGKELSVQLINEGVDFLFPNADAAGLGAYFAAEDAMKEGKKVYTFGVNRDKSQVSPTTILANGVITPKAFVKVAKMVKEAKENPNKKFSTKLITFNMITDQAISFNYNPDMKDQIPEDVIKAVAKAKSEILSGKLEVPQIDFTNKAAEE